MKGGVAIAVECVSKRYAGTLAVDDVSFGVMTGEIFGVLGTNGAGKTTVLECMEGLRRQDRGTIRVLGLDPQRDTRALRLRIGVQLQDSALQARLKVWEAVDLFAGLYSRPLDWRPLLADLGLAERENVPFGRLSAGQKQRLFIALALINRPAVVFLDELTTALDPQGRRAMWDIVRRVRDGGATVVLTTHLMDEAERLCDRIAIMHRGRVIAMDSPEHLVRRFGRACRITIDAGGIDPEQLTQVASVARVERNGGRIIAHSRTPSSVGDVVSALTAMGVGGDDIRIDQPTLEDVFLELTGASSSSAHRESVCVRV